MKRFPIILSIFLAFCLAAATHISVRADSDGPIQDPDTFQVFLPAIINGNTIKAEEEQDPIQSWLNGDASQLVGVLAADLFSLPVVQQPEGDSSYISSSAGTLTQFAAASAFGSTGLLAHAALAGSQFSSLQVSESIQLVYGDGSIHHFQVVEIHTFQALQPSDPFSSFVNLQSGETLSSGQLFLQMYAGQPHLTLQTCISQDGIPAWGRLFIIAEPIPAQ